MTEITDPNRTLITGCHIYTADPNMPDAERQIRNAALVIDGEYIHWLGAESALPEELKTTCQTQIALEGGWLLPGLIDCHTHLVYGGQRANEFQMRQAGATYSEIAQQGGGILSTVKATRAADEQRLFDNALNRLSNWHSEGVTSIEIKSGYGLTLEDELKMLKVARALGNAMPIDVYTTLLAAHTLAPEFDNQDDYIEHIIETILPAACEQELADAIDGFCEHIGFSPEQIKRLFDAAAERGLPVKLHAEQLSNLEGAKLAAGFNALSADHLEYLDEDGVKAMQEAGTVAVLLPGAFYFLRETKLPPIELLRQHQVPIAVATDSNPGSSPCQSLLLMLNMGCTLFNLTIEEALMGVTANAAKALGIDNRVGTISVGRQADLSFYAVDDLSELAYYFGSNPCQMVFKSGIRVLG